MPCSQMGKDGLKAFHPSKNVHVMHVQCCEKGFFFLTQTTMFCQIEPSVSCLNLMMF